MSDFLSLRFTGNDVLPSNTRCKEVARLISAAEQFIESMLEEDESYEGGMILCLEKIEAKSLGLKFTGPQMGAALAVWSTLAAAVNTGKIEELPAKAKESFAEIFNFVRNRNCAAEISDSRNPCSVLATISPDMAMPETLRASSRVSLIGEVMSVGGVEPKVRLKLPNGKIFSCKATEEIARELGGRLYQVVTVQGEGTWDLETDSLIKFKIKSMKTFVQGKASEAISALAEAMPATLQQWQAEGLENVFLTDEAV